MKERRRKTSDKETQQEDWCEQPGVCVCVLTCVFVVGGGLWLLRAAALLEEQGGSFDHEEALAEAGNNNNNNIILLFIFEISVLISREVMQMTSFSVM